MTDRMCAVAGCPRKPKGRAIKGTLGGNKTVRRGPRYCVMHLYRIRKYGEPGPAESTKGTRGTCAIPDCGLVTEAKGLCKRHNSQRRRGITPGTPIRTYAPKGSGYIQASSGYRIVRRDGKQVREHRMIMEEILGRPLRPFEDVHHRNGIRHDNRPENLEVMVRTRGQRVADLVDFIVTHYEAEVLSRLDAKRCSVQQL